MTRKNEKDDEVSLKVGPVKEVVAPDLEYRAQGPSSPGTRMALIGCGGISGFHLQAARHWGVDIVALVDRNPEAARARRDEFYPEADLYEDARAVFERADIDAVDLATHPDIRAPLIEAALNEGKHVFSQKPFVLDLDAGRRLAELAARQERILAINQNGRWAPYVRWAIQAVRQGLLGSVHSLDWSIQWDHTWTRGTAFESIRHLILYDFAIHWVDITAQVFRGQPAESVFARATHAPEQEIKPPALANLSISFEHGLATLGFSAHARFGPLEQFSIVGSKGTLRGAGDVCGIRSLDLFTREGKSRIELEGSWFPDGFFGSLGAFLEAIETSREPEHAAMDNLRSLELVFAAIGSADSGKAIQPGVVRSIAM